MFRQRVLGEDDDAWCAVDRNLFRGALDDQPEIGRIVRELGQAFLRELIHPPFRIVYRLDQRVSL